MFIHRTISRYQPLSPLLELLVPEASQTSVLVAQILAVRLVSLTQEVYSVSNDLQDEQFGLCLGASPRVKGMDIKLSNQKHQGQQLINLPLEIRLPHPGHINQSSARSARLQGDPGDIA